MKSVFQICAITKKFNDDSTTTKTKHDGCKSNL